MQRNFIKVASIEIQIVRKINPDTKKYKWTNSLVNTKEYILMNNDLDWLEMLTRQCILLDLSTFNAQIKPIEGTYLSKYSNQIHMPNKQVQLIRDGLCPCYRLETWIS